MEGPWAKRNRAHSHGVTLQREIEAIWPPQHHWPVRTESDRSGLEYRFYLGEIPAVDDNWALAVGEILFNLRSALDHLAYELHVRRFRGQVPPKVDGITQFPIYETEPDWSKNFYRIKNLSSRDRRALKQYQPYITRNDKLADHRSYLRYLNRLHNFDKHRKLHVVTGSQVSIYFPEHDFPARCGFQSHPTWGPLKQGDLIDRWTFREPPPQMEEHPGATLDVAIEYRGDWGIVVPLLYGMDQTVGAVLDRFADRFA